MATAVWDLGWREVLQHSGRGRAPRPEANPAEGVRARGRVPAVVRRRRTLTAAAVLAALALTALPSALDLAGLRAPAEAGTATVEGPGEAPPRSRAVVGPGDTLWEIAARNLPEDADLQSYVAEIILVNDVDPAHLQPGSILDLPQP